MFSQDEMKRAMQTKNFKMPTGLSKEATAFFIKEVAKDSKFYDNVSHLNNEDTISEIKILMHNAKKWESSILVDGGVSYFYPEECVGNEGKGLKSRYRVSMSSKDRDVKKLKYKIKDCRGEIFSVAAKTQSEAQEVVNQIFGSGHYRVSQMMV
jgi:hypothetical protein